MLFNIAQNDCSGKNMTLILPDYKRSLEMPLKIYKRKSKFITKRNKLQKCTTTIMWMKEKWHRKKDNFQYAVNIILISIVKRKENFFFLVKMT